MKRKFLLSILTILAISICNEATIAQTPAVDNSNTIKVAAGAQYKRSPFYRFFWGTNYRNEWTTPVSLPQLYLDTLRGGLLSYKVGGSNQTKSLHLTTMGEKEYTLRSVDKTLNKVIPDVFEGTFVADIVNDAISMSNPYGALAVPGMAKAIKINHTMPQYFYLPEQKALDTLNKKFAGKMYLFEQRPKGDWTEADNLGNFKKFKDLEDMLEDIKENHNNMIDQPAFVRARLLDMLIGDFDRHGDQWKWGIRKEGDKRIYVPVPTDRDQAFSTRSGLLLTLVIKIAGLKYIQPYDEKIHDVEGLAQINRLLDRLVTNKMTLAEWQAIATDVKSLLTDEAIENSVKGMPPEIFAIRGEKLISNLKNRRDHLLEYVTDYYGLLAEEVEVVGTKEDEYFEINNLADNMTEIKMYHLNENRKGDSEPFYSRVFNKNETDEIRLYGISGNDVFQVNGSLNKKIIVRIIGGNMRDSIVDLSPPSHKTQVHVYDNKDNFFKTTAATQLHLSEKSAVHTYNYNSFKQD
ncbi:MAG: hypothetical protein ABIO05_05285, partial [Ferruginibacter sp.]